MTVKPLTVLLALLTIAYPVVVYVGLGHVEPRDLACLLAALAVARAVAARQPFWWAAAAGACLLALLSFLGNAALPLKLYPVLVNAVFLAAFAISLRHPPTAIERLARLADPQLPPEAVPYTRRVTEVWCLFFLVNGAAAMATAVWASADVWALYNGLLSYLLMATLFGAEWLVRRRVRARAAAASLETRVPGRG